MTVHLGPKRNKLINANKDEAVYDATRARDRAFDQLFHQNVITKTLITPPGSPSNGDAYMIMAGTSPTGAWTGWAGRVAVWSTDICLPGSNVPAPAWDYLTPRQGDLIYVADEEVRYNWNGTQFVYDTGIFGGIEFPGNGVIKIPSTGYSEYITPAWTETIDLRYVINNITEQSCIGTLGANASLNLCEVYYLRNAKIDIGFSNVSSGIQASTVMLSGDFTEAPGVVSSASPVVTFAQYGGKSRTGLAITNTSSDILTFMATIKVI